MALQKSELAEVFQQAFMPQVNDALATLFASADSAVLKLATESSENREQNRYFEAAQSLRIVRFGIVDSFSQSVLQSANDGSSVDADHARSLRNLLSVRPDEYKADSSLAAAIHDLDERLVEISSDYVNPLLPEHFVESFLASLAVANIDVHTKMLVLRLFEGQLYKKIESFVRDTNTALAKRGVLPALETAPSDLSQSMQDIVEETIGGDGAETELSKLEIALAELQVDDVEKLYEITDSADAIALWQQFAVLRDVIAELEAAKLMPAELSSRGKVLIEKIPLVKRIFELLTEDELLPDLAKSMLLALQLPYTRIALEDEQFFLQEAHPARLLLKEAARLCYQWQPNLDDISSDKVYQKLLMITQRFIEVERISTLPYQEMQFELLAVGESIRQKVVRNNQRLMDSEFGAQASDMARVEVQNLLHEKMQQHQLPYAASRVLQEAWSHVLYLVALRKGVNSQQWLKAVDVVDMLIDSFKPASAYSYRSELLGRLPLLLRSLRDGLSSIDMENDVIDQMFGELEEAHKALAVAIGGGIEDGTLDILQKASQQESESLDIAENLAENAVEQEVQVAEEPKDDVMNLLQNIQAGMLLNWHRPEGAIRCRMAAFIKHTNKYILTDRSGAKLTELLDKDMAQKLSTREIEPFETLAEFDKTLESVIGGMRGPR